MIVSDVFARVKRTFGDESGVQLTEEDIIRYINDAQREAVMQNEGLLPEVQYIDLVGGQDRYAFPSTAFTVFHAYCKNSGNAEYYKLKWVSVFQLSVYADGWQGNSLTDFPRVFTKETNQIILFPRPHESLEGGLKLHVGRYAKDVEDSNSELDVPPWLYTMVINFCLTQAFEMDEDWQAAQVKLQQVQGDLNFNNHRDSWFGRDTYPVISPRFEADEEF